MDSIVDDSDITDLVRKAAQTLSNENPFLCDESTFRLQEAMQALELTHPLMDKCDLPISVYSRPLDLLWRQDSDLIKNYMEDCKVPPRMPPVGLDDETSPLPWPTLSLHKARIISLEHIIRLESMLTGSDILESMYTSLYVHDGVLSDMKEQLELECDENTVDFTEVVASKWAVFASSLILVKSCELIRSIIVHADIYEEEDFSDFAGGRDFSFFSVIKSDDEVVKYVTNAIKTLRTFENDQNGFIIKRCLVFQLCLYIACSWMSQLTSVTVRIKAEGIKAMLTDCVLHIHNIISSLEVDGVDYSEDDILVLFQSFDVHMNRPLLGNHPVRKVEYKTAIESLKSIKNIITQINLGVCDVLLKGTTLEQIHFMLQLFSQTSSNILVRSLMLYNLHFDGLVLGQYNFEQLIVDHLHCCGVPPILTMADASFISLLSKPIYNILKLMTLNRNRQRAFIEYCVIPEWLCLQSEAAALDSFCTENNRLEPQTVPIMSNFVLSMTVWVMDLYVSLGIELGLISQHQELSIALWYWDYLLSCGISCHTLMGKRHAKYVASKEIALDSNGLTRSSDYVGYLKLLQMICRGVMRLISALTQENILKPLFFTFTSDEIIFNKRFEAFREIQHPTTLSFDDYLHFLNSKKIDSVEHINYAITCFKLSKTMIEQLQTKIQPTDDFYLQKQASEVANLTTVCAINIAFAETLLRGIKDSSTSQMKVSFDFQVHRQFCCFQITVV